MAAYEANHSDKEAERARNTANNANNIRNAADVAIASKNPYGVAAGAAVKGLDKVTGGKSSEALGKAMTRANEITPMGNHFQNASNRLSESGASNLAGRAAGMKNGIDNRKNQVKNKNGNSGGEQNGSLPSSDSQKNKNMMQQNQGTPNNGAARNGSGSGANGGEGSSDSKKDDNDRTISSSKTSSSASESAEEEKKSGGILGFGVSLLIKVVILLVAPFFLLILFMVVIVGGVSGMFSEYEDAVGISEASGSDTGGIYFDASSQDQQDFYDRVNDIKLTNQVNGRNVDSMKVVSVIHILNLNGADIDYSELGKSEINEIVDSMFEGNTYSESLFRANLKSRIIPKYVKNATDKEIDQIVDDIFDYIDRYNGMIDKNNGDNDLICSGEGACSYDIKGFYIHGKGNIAKNIQVSNLYVRLMQCGTGDGHNYGGVFGQPLEGEELVPFEKYILGVAYQEIGPNSPKEAVKAQMVAARSYILARPTDMGGWRTLRKESDGKWVLQVAACTQDQVYCDPDRGCSSNDGQWGQVHSGLNYNTGFVRGPLANDSLLRTYAKETNGEVLVNSSDYIVYSGYVQTEQNKFIALANHGLNYKQILLQVYNQGVRNYGAKNVEKSNCEKGVNCSYTTTGEFTNWKQYQGPWIDTPMGNSGKNVRQIGCLVTSVSMLIMKSGVQTTITPFNPGTFVEFLNRNNGFADGGNFLWESASFVAPSFHYQDQVDLSHMSYEQKLETIKSIVNQKNVYAVAEVKGNTGQHWVAIDSVQGNTIRMFDPGSDSNDMWSEYNWANTSAISYYRVG